MTLSMCKLVSTRKGRNEGEEVEEVGGVEARERGKAAVKCLLVSALTF